MKNGYQPKKKSIGMLHPKYRKSKLPKGGLGLEKNETHKYGKLPNGATLVKPTDRPAPKQPMVKFKNGSEIHSIDSNDRVRGQSASNLWMNSEIQCHSCSNKDICKYQGDYLEQVVHIIDVYDGVFELSCSHYEKGIKRKSAKLDIEREDLKPKSFKLKEKVEFRVITDNEVYIYNDYLKALLKATYLDEEGIKCKISRVCVKEDGGITIEYK